jgi:hypothetical protein
MPQKQAPVTALEALMHYRFLRNIRLDGDCIVWTGEKCPAGYGRFRIQKRIYMAHRVTYTVAYGLVPEGLEVDHLCRNRACINPQHLEAVTHLENVARSVRARIGQPKLTRKARSKAHSNGTGRVNAAKTHCPQGHPYEGDNLILMKSRSGRKCRTCAAISREKGHAIQRANRLAIKASNLKEQA